MSGKIKKQDVLALCLDEIRSGRVSPQDCLKKYPELEKELSGSLEQEKLKIVMEIIEKRSANLYMLEIIFFTFRRFVKQSIACICLEVRILA